MEGVKILAFKYSESSQLKLCPNGRYSIIRNEDYPFLQQGMHSLSDIQLSSYKTILSIEVEGVSYKIGDKIRHKDKPDDSYHEITKFYMKNNSEDIYTETAHYKHSGLCSKNLLKEGEIEPEELIFEQQKICFESLPLLVSEDGFNVFETDVIYGVNPRTYEIFHCEPCLIGEGLLIFVEERKAKDWILYNKKEFNLQDLIDICPEKEKELIELAKTRIYDTSSIS